MKFSIITVNYNNKDGLEKTIKSIIGQTFYDYELIIIDGGSNDGSADILKEYDAFITYWISEKDKGIYNAMNKGILKATGEYLNFMNSGDCFYTPDILEKVDKIKTDADFIVGKDYHFSDKTKKGHASNHPPYITMIHFFTSTLDHQSSFIKRELFNNSLYNENYRWVSDWVFFTEKIVSESKSVQFIPDIICLREEGQINRMEINKLEMDNFLQTFLPYGVYRDYATLTKMERSSLYKLLDICENEKMRKVLNICIKAIFKLMRGHHVPHIYP